MANYYTEFSFELDFTPEQHRIAIVLFEQLSDESEKYNDLREDVFGDPNQVPYFSVKVTSSDNYIKWWIYEDAAEGIPEHVAEFLYYLVAHHDYPPCGFEWGNSCSKPQLDAFGGGRCMDYKKRF